MNVRSETRRLIARIPLRYTIFVGLVLGWILLSTVIPVPAPPGGGNPSGPD